jgi:hypothetical protein
MGVFGVVFRVFLELGIRVGVYIGSIVALSTKEIVQDIL